MALALVLLAVPSAALATTPSSYAQAALDSGATSYWPLDDSTGPAWNAAGGPDAAVAGTVGFGRGGAFGGSSAMSTQGGAGFLTAPSTPATFPTGTFSVEAWINASDPAGAQHGIVEDYDSTGVNVGWLLRLHDGKLWGLVAAAGSGAEVAYGATPVSAGEWHHVAMTYDGVVLKLYLDGQLDGQDAGALGPTANNDGIKIGTTGVDDGRFRFLGDIDEVAVYDRALSAAEVQERFAGIPPTSSGRPAIEGAPLTGATLTAGTGTWRGADGPTYAYQWQVCEVDGTGCTDVAGATGSQYVVRAADSGKRLRVVVTATDADGSGTATSRTTVPVDGYGARVLADGATSYWPLDDSEGPAWNAAGGPDAAVAGSVGFGGDGAFGGSTAMSTLGGAGFLTAPSVPATFRPGAFSVEAFIKPSDTSGLYRGIVEDYDSTGVNHGWLLRLNDGKLTGMIAPAGIESEIAYGQTPVTTDAWHHVAMTYDGSVLKIYLDGQLEAEDAGEVAPDVNNDGIKIGTTGVDEARYRFLGDIDDVALFSRALTASEIGRHEAAVVPDTAAPEVTLSGSLYDGRGQWLDGSGYGLHVDADDGTGGGVASVEVLVDGTRADYATSSCSSPCPMSLDWTLTSAGFAEGAHTVTVAVVDAAGNRTERDVDVLLDRSAPTVTLGGTLWDDRARLLPADSYDLSVAAEDGTSADPRSGVKSIEILVDDERVDYVEQDCPAGSCPLTRDYTFPASDYRPGRHKIDIVVFDQLGQESRTTYHVVTRRAPGPPAAPALATAATVFDQTQLLVDGPDAVQVIEPGTVQPQTASLVQGDVVGPDNQPLPWAEVSIVGHPEYGTTTTTVDGGVYMGVNGGSVLRARVAMDGYDTVERTVAVPAQNHAAMGEVVLQPR